MSSDRRLYPECDRARHTTPGIFRLMNSPEESRRHTGVSSHSVESAHQHVEHRLTQDPNFSAKSAIVQGQMAEC